jgi:hypothetical protein
VKKPKKTRAEREAELEIAATKMYPLSKGSTGKRKYQAIGLEKGWFDEDK